MPSSDLPGPADPALHPERSLCWVEAENRKHSIRAILATLCPQSEPDEQKAAAYRATINERMAALGKHGL